MQCFRKRNGRGTSRRCRRERRRLWQQMHKTSPSSASPAPWAGKAHPPARQRRSFPRKPRSPATTRPSCGRQAPSSKHRCFSAFHVPGEDQRRSKARREPRQLSGGLSAGHRRFSPSPHHDLETTYDNGKCWGKYGEIYFCIAENRKNKQFQPLAATGCCDAKFHPMVDKSLFLR
ncbi:hypothetical protein AGR13a_Cc170022 [Agrobacterium genomosp. 13 str. CFBP 6927]|uniref:Uncharacterized protein n=1 Tax=Agrobacterium genomosp. 13 str. CFBP 6927 TaxID=1183428 RepID=A0ABP2BF00_9HYPH|nr:hypothetical protein AGR13a_Cc170022 [Agrobacterium genomosp. 13 str. CFBP 6927]